MKRIALLLIAALTLASCVSSLPAKFTSLADKVEKKGAEFSEAQWESANATYDKLMEEYAKVENKLNDEQKKEITSAIGRYNAAALKAGLGKVGSAIEEAVEGAKGFLEGLGGGGE